MQTIPQGTPAPVVKMSSASLAVVLAGLEPDLDPLLLGDGEQAVADDRADDGTAEDGRASAQANVAPGVRVRERRRRR